MKKHNMKKRIIAMAMTLITMISVTSAAVVPASAKSVGDMAKDAGLAATNKSIDALVEMGAECIPGGKILGAAGVAVIDSLFGNIFHTEEEPDPTAVHLTRTTDEILADVNEMSQNMTTFHNEEMTAIKDIANKVDDVNDKVALNNFNADRIKAESSHKDFIYLISENSSYISSSFAEPAYKVIDKNTYNAFCDIVNNTDIRQKFRTMEVHLGNQEKTYDMITDVAKKQYDRTTTQMVTEEHKDGSVGVQNLRALENYLSYENVKNEIKGYQADMIIYYTDCVQLAQMEYDIRNYKAYQEYQGDNTMLQQALDKSTAQLNTAVSDYTKDLNAVMDSYNANCAKLDAAQAATVTVTVNGQGYTFTSDDAMRAWMLTSTLSYFDLDDHVDVSFTLDKDWVASADYGLAGTADMRQALDNSVGYGTLGLYDYVGAPRCDFNTTQKLGTACDLTINLNGHVIDMNQSANELLLSGFMPTGTLTINGDADRDSKLIGGCFQFIDVTRRDAGMDMKVQGVEITGRGNSNRNLFQMSGNYTVTLDNCTVNAKQDQLTNLTGSAFRQTNCTVNYNL